MLVPTLALSIGVRCQDAAGKDKIPSVTLHWLGSFIFHQSRQLTHFLVHQVELIPGRRSTTRVAKKLERAGTNRDGGVTKPTNQVLPFALWDLLQLVEETGDIELHVLWSETAGHFKKRGDDR